MPKIEIGSGSIEAAAAETLQDVLKKLRDNRDLAKQLGQNAVIEKAVAAVYCGEPADLSRPVGNGGTLEFLTADSEKGLNVLRHSASHVMAQAVLRLYPGAQFGVGPAIQDGFYYDIGLPAGSQITDADLPRIEEEMEKIVQADLPVIREEMARDAAMAFFRSAGQTYKLELISEIPDATVSVYRQGEFADLCRGPHLPSTRKLQAFRLLSVSGAYWRGSEKNAMLTRVYGTAFADKKALKDHLAMIEEAKKRDHPKLGRELDLFSFHEEGPGLVFWKPKGLAVKNLLIEFMRGKHAELGYVEIETPTIMRDQLWKTSGHWDNYRDNMFFTERDEETYAIKPMNCPGGMLVYRETMHSYRELPLKVAEFGKVHRFERSGVLQGLFRVRGFTQDDAHIFTDAERLQQSVIEVIRLVDGVYRAFGFEYKVELSTRPEQSMGTQEEWDIATAGLKNALDELKLDYKINEGDGAFYGPKIDFHLKDAIGRTHQCGTIQLDMKLPERFDLTYVGEDGKEHRVIMLHRAILGSLERFIGILIEHYGGKFPVWLAPVQAVILPVSDRFNALAGRLQNLLRNAKIRVESDLSNEKLGYKIRQAQMAKVPYMLVVGEKEEADGTVSVRHREQGDQGSLTPEAFAARVAEESARRE